MAMKYKVIKNIISPEVVSLLNKYLCRKHEVSNWLIDQKIVSPVSSYSYWGGEDFTTAYATNGDVMMDTMLEVCKPLIEKVFDLELIECYSYTRIYKTGNVLERHIDRTACEISGTLHLGGDEWPIFLDPTGGKNNKGIEVNLKQGDILLYRGNELEHWREKFEGKHCSQVFFHYNDKNGQFGETLKYDKRTMLGIPSR
jgi:hypothetical protein|tara:strand:+ start:50 stop:646 length:597 start_codon:yes stop_codon:yes gene_type:complete